jgi:hypothetical protein
MHRAPHLGYVGIVSIVVISSMVACSSAPQSLPAEGSGAPSGPTAAAAPPADQATHADSLETGVSGEHFAPLDVGANKLSGIFVKNGVSLAFEVQHAPGSSVFRLSTVSGDELYSQVQGPSGIEMRVGSTFRSLLPLAPGAALPSHPTFSPEGLQSSGDLEAAFDALKGTPIALLPHLSAALGRVGLTGDRARTAMAVHSTAMYLTKTLGLEMDNDVRAATNKLVVTGRASRDGLPATQEGATGLSVAAPQTSGPERTEDLVTRNYSGSWYCQYGYRREWLGNMTDNPCRDNCLGMCGPGCSPWDWICGDENVHTACWRHDSASECDWWDLGCWAVYGAYSTWIFTDTEELGMCENTPWVDYYTDPTWWGLGLNHYGYYEYDQNFWKN